MKTSQELFSHAATILAVKDIEKSMNFYEQKLGFEITFKWNSPTDYAVLKRGEVSLHLSKRTEDASPISNHIALYIFVHDIDAVYQELQEKRVKINTLIGTREYAMRDFDIKDPDGYLISFGMGV